MAESPKDVVCGFFAGFGKSVEEDEQTYRKYLAEDVQYFTGTTMVRSVDELLVLVRKASDLIGLKTWWAEILNIISEGEVVVSERIDHQIGLDDKEAFPTVILGIMKIRDGKIVEWRDYWDPRELMDYGEKFRAKKGISAQYGDAVGAASKAALDASESSIK